jgi:hypothetical protein
MSNSDLAALLVEALDQAAARAAGSGAALLSVEISLLAPAVPAAIETRVQRQTRTLLFLEAEARDPAGARLATAASVHKLG